MWEMSLPVRNLWRLFLLLVKLRQASNSGLRFGCRHCQEGGAAAGRGDWAGDRAVLSGLGAVWHQALAHKSKLCSVVKFAVFAILFVFALDRV